MPIPESCKSLIISSTEQKKQCSLIKHRLKFPEVNYQLTQEKKNSLTEIELNSRGFVLTDTADDRNSITK